MKETPNVAPGLCTCVYKDKDPHPFIFPEATFAWNAASPSKLKNS